MIVMMICHYDDTNSSGGLDKQARLLSRTMRAAGHDVVMLASTRKWSRAGWTSDEGVPVRYFWTYASPQVSGRYFLAALIWAVQLMLWVLLNRREIKILHCHQIRIHAFVACIASKFLGIPSVLKSATGGVGADIKAISSRKYFGVKGGRFIMRNASVFVATTLSIEEDLTSYGVDRQKVIVIPNGLRLPSVSHAAPDPTRATKALFLSRLAPDKNAPALALAALEWTRSHDLEVDFWGAGNMRQELEDTIATGGRQSRVRFCGYAANPSDVLERYGYLLLPSNAEGLSNAMLEAMAHGVVPLTTKVSGCVDHIQEGVTGFFFNGVDHRSLTMGLQEIENVSRDQWQVLSENVRTYAYTRFDINQVGGAYADLYRRLIEGGWYINSPIVAQHSSRDLNKPRRSDPATMDSAQAMTQEGSRSGASCSATTGL